MPPPRFLTTSLPLPLALALRKLALSSARSILTPDPAVNLAPPPGDEEPEPLDRGPEGEEAGDAVTVGFVEAARRRGSACEVEVEQEKDGDARVLRSCNPLCQLRTRRKQRAHTERREDRVIPVDTLVRLDLLERLPGRRAHNHLDGAELGSGGEEGGGVGDESAEGGEGVLERAKGRVERGSGRGEAEEEGLGRAKDSGEVLDRCRRGEEVREGGERVRGDALRKREEGKDGEGVEEVPRELLGGKVGVPRPGPEPFSDEAALESFLLELVEGLVVLLLREGGLFSALEALLLVVLRGRRSERRGEGVEDKKTKTEPRRERWKTERGSVSREEEQRRTALISYINVPTKSTANTTSATLSSWCVVAL